MSPFQKKTSLVLILAIIFSFGFGMATMQMDKDGNMSDCPFMGMNAICQMGASEHIGAFQNMFSGVQTRSALVSILFIFLALSSLMIPKGNSPPNMVGLLIKECPHLYNFNKILLALSDGIIQPKIYA